MPCEIGTVSRWYDEKGFGFIVQHGTKDSIYVHRTGLVGVDALCDGDEVEYERYQDPMDVRRGKERAGNVRVLSHSVDGRSSGGRSNSRLADVPPRPPPGPPIGLGPYELGDEDFLPEDPAVAPPLAEHLEYGVVRSWNDKQKYGFIAPDRGGECIYVHISGLEGMEFLMDGDWVEFARSQEDPRDAKRGKERAVAVRLASEPFDSEQYAEPGELPSRVLGLELPSRRPGPQEPPHPPPARRVPLPSPGPLVEHGRVSRWVDEKGYGFIVHHDSQDSIYVHRTGLMGAAALQEGDEVEYERFQDVRDFERGKVRCVNVRVLEASGPGQETFPFEQDEYRGGHDSGRGPPEHSHFGTPHSVPPSHSVPPFGQEPGEIGTVINWNDEKGFGFIQLQGSKETIYMHRTGLAAGSLVRSGDTVEFERTQDRRDVNRGKERAVNVRVVAVAGTRDGGVQSQYQNPFLHSSIPIEDRPDRRPAPGRAWL